MATAVLSRGLLVDMIVKSLCKQRLHVLQMILFFLNLILLVKILCEHLLVQF